MPLLPRKTGSRGHAAGALHSRIVENSIAAAKMANTIERLDIFLHDDRKPGAPQGVRCSTRIAFLLCGCASNGIMTRVDQGTIRKVTSDDLEVGLICADRDGNRVRIDRLDRQSGIVAYHFLNDELRVQEGVQERPIDRFLAEGWYIAAKGKSL